MPSSQARTGLCFRRPKKETDSVKTRLVCDTDGSAEPHGKEGSIAGDVLAALNDLGP